jgi:hypothetical protein
MKRFALGFLLTLFVVALPANSLAQMPELKPLKGTPNPTPPKDPHSFTFILAGDNRPDKAMCSSDADKSKKAPCPPTAVVQQLFQDIKQQSPAFVLWTGDVISGKDPDSPKNISEEYKAFLAVAASGKAAVYNAPGNHEMNDKNNCPNESMVKFYLKDTDQKNPYGSFDYGDSHFIALDSDEDTPKKSDPCNCSHFTGDDKPPGYISQQQMDALAEDLKANKDKDHIFIFLHRPLEAYKSDDLLCSSNVSAMQALFKQYPNISYVVAGHEHMYYNLQGANDQAKFYDSPPSRTDPDSSGPYYLVSGGAGAPLKSIKVNGEKTKSFFHYLVFTVDKSTVTAQMVKLNIPEKSKVEDDN